MKWIRASRSLLLSGMADAWTAARGKPPADGEHLGLILMVVSAAAFALMAAFAKKLLPDTPIQAVVLSRGVLMSIVFVLVARRQRIPITGTRRGLLVLRGLLGYAALSCYFYSVQHLPLGDAVLLQYSHPLFVAAIAPLFLHESTARGHGWLLLAALVGVGLIVRPSGEVRPDALVGVLGATLSGLAYMTVRQLSHSEHPMTILVWFPLVSIPFSAVATFSAGRAALPSSERELAGHLLVTLAALVGQFALTQGLARAGAARATAVTLSGPVFGIVFGLLLFGTIPTTASIAGTAIVLTALGILGWSKPRGAPKATDSAEPSTPDPSASRTSPHRA